MTFWEACLICKEREKDSFFCDNTSDRMQSGRTLGVSMPEKDMELELEIVTTSRMKCGRCGEEDEYEQDSPVQIRTVHTRTLKKEGWKYTTSKREQIEGFFCPNCIQELSL